MTLRRTQATKKQQQNLKTPPVPLRPSTLWQSSPLPLNSVQLLLASTSLQMNGQCLSHSGFGRRSRLGVIKALCGANRWLNAASSPSPSILHWPHSAATGDHRKVQRRGWRAALRDIPKQRRVWLREDKTGTSCLGI